MANTLNLGDGQWATKEGSLLGYNSENNNYKPLPFTFDRASSATRVNKDGLIETVGADQPRVDYLNDSKGALLLEPQRTNRIPNSEDGSTWSLNNITLSSLSGGLNKEYYQITSLGNTGRFDVVQNNWVNLTAGTYTASVFAKKGTCDEIILTTRANLSAQSAYGVFNLTSGTVVSTSGLTGSIEPYSDGWYRCAITFTNSGGYTDFASFAFGFNFNSSSTDTLFVASPQSEIGSYPTSYIPTQGSAVTRVADVCNNGGNEQVINSTEGTIYGEQKSLETDFSYNYFSAVSDGTNNNRLEIRQSSTGLQFLWRVGGTYQSNIILANAPFTSTIKYALRYSSTDIKFYVNGSLVGTINSPTLYATGTLDNIQFANGSGGDSFRGVVKECKYYNTALTDQELINLTTI